MCEVLHNHIQWQRNPFAMTFVQLAVVVGRAITLQRVFLETMLGFRVFTKQDEVTWAERMVFKDPVLVYDL